MAKIQFKTLLCLSLAVALTGCGAIQFASIPGESQASLTLKHDVSRLLLAAASHNLGFSADNPNCVEKVSVKSIVRTKILRGTASQGSWKEIWYVKICNKTIPYEVSFLPDGSGGTYFSISQFESNSHSSKSVKKYPKS